MCLLLLASVGRAPPLKACVCSTTTWNGAAIIFLLWSAFAIDVAGQLTWHP